jgi:thymidine kinase
MDYVNLNLNDAIMWKEYRTIPFETIYATFAPIEVIRRLKTVCRHCYMLESLRIRADGGGTPSSATTRSGALCSDGVLNIKGAPV